jgi:hypothetical protein
MSIRLPVSCDSMIYVSGIRGLGGDFLRRIADVTWRPMESITSLDGANMNALLTNCGELSYSFVCRQCSKTVPCKQKTTWARLCVRCRRDNENAAEREKYRMRGGRS